MQCEEEKAITESHAFRSATTTRRKIKNNFITFNPNHYELLFIEIPGRIKCVVPN